MDPLALLRLQAETMWGRSPAGLGSGTVHAVISTYDGRAELLPGTTTIGSESATLSTQARSWLLRPSAADVPVPPDLTLLATGADLGVPRTWEASEWSELLAGEHGPWAALASEGQLVSLAHCARLGDAAAEVGVETDPAFRGRGLAVMVVRAWVRALTPLRSHLFYSAFEDNPGSHRVAAKCGATPLGRLCRLRVP